MCFSWQLWQRWTFHSEIRSAGFRWEPTHISVTMIDLWTKTRWPRSLHPRTWIKWNQNTRCPRRHGRFGQTEVCHAVCRSSSIRPRALTSFSQLSPAQELVMVLWGSAAVYGLRLPDSINFYDMSESSSHVPRGRGRVIGVRQRQGGPSAVTPVINLQRGTAASRSGGVNKSRHYCFCCFVLSTLPTVVSPTSDLTTLQSKQHKDFRISSVQGFWMRNHRHPGCDWFCVLFSDKSHTESRIKVTLTGVHKSLKLLFSNHLRGMNRLFWWTSHALEHFLNGSTSWIRPLDFPSE